MSKKNLLLCGLTFLMCLSLGLYGCRKDSDKSTTAEHTDPVYVNTEAETSAVSIESKTSAEETTPEADTTATDPEMTELNSESEEETVSTESVTATETTEAESVTVLETAEMNSLTEDTSEAATILDIEGDVEIIIPDDMGDGGL